jgi:hypothetical protein
MHVEIETEALDRDRFSAAINGQMILFGGPVPDARQIKNTASYAPADKCKGEA